MASASPLVADTSAESPGRGLADLAEDTQELECPQDGIDEELLPSQTLEAKAWGRLASLDYQQFPDILLEKAEEIIGRQHAENNLKVSREHCRILRPESGPEEALVENWSSTGLQLNGSPVEKGHLVKLSDKDTITLGVAEAGCPQYIFLLTDTKKRTHQEVSQSEGSAQPASPSRASSFQTGQSSMQGGGQSSISGSPLKRMKGIELSDAEKSARFECGICHDIWHNCVTTLPCFHTFCAACLSGWVKRSNTCPQCRKKLTAVNKNRDLNALLEDFLKENPEKRRDPEDLAQADKENIFDKDPFPLPVAHRDGVEDSDDFGSDSEESHDLSENACPQCPPAQRGGFTCIPTMNHISCGACFQLMPDRDLTIQRCHWCRQVGCDIYFRSLPPPREGLPDECTGLEAERLKKLNERVWNTLPISSFHTNQVEQQVLRQYLAEHQKSVQDAVSETLTKVESREWDFPREHIQPAGPVAQPLPANLAHDSPLCGSCSDRVVGGILYKYREAIPKADLPAQFANRDNCWWGWECRTQTHRLDHATRLNHVCERTRTAAGSH